MAITENNVSAIYYLAWYRAYNGKTIFLFSPLVLNKYSDDTWPMYSDIEKKIKSALVSKGAENNAKAIVYGYFTDILVVNEIFETLKQNIQNTGLQIDIIRTASPKPDSPTKPNSTSKDFWNN